MVDRAPSIAAVVGWVTLLLLLLLALGGAAEAPGGLWLGFPGAAPALLAGLALAGLAAWAGLPAGAPVAGLAVIPLLVLSGLPMPGLSALSGPPLLAAAAGGVVLVCAGSQRTLPRGAFLPVVGLVYALGAARVQSQVGPAGDEPHYLMVADSLWRDHDVALSRDYAEGRYRAFHDGPLEPHYRVRGKGGEIYSVHAVGLSLLILPAYALGGYPAASFFMALLAAFLAREVRELVRDWTGQDRLAEGVGWLVAFSPPLVHFAGLIFTEVPAALAVTLGLRYARGRRGTAATLGWAAAVMFLPWLHVRYAVLSLALVVYALSGRPARRALVVLMAVGAAAALGLAAYHLALYGTPDPRVVWGRRPEFALAALPLGLQGLLLDQEFGLLAYAPVFVLAIPGLWILLRARRAEGLTGLGIVLAVLLTAGAWHMWRGGWNPPARFLVPVLPVLAAAVAMSLRRGVGAAAALLVGWGLWTGLAGAWQPRLVHRDRDGTAPFFRAYSGAEEWTRLLPGFVLDESAADRGRLAAVWAVALAAAAAASRRSKRPPGVVQVAAAALAWLGFAGTASSLSRSRTGGRDAVRLLGRAAIRVPGWRLERSAQARWGPGALEWGPLYEPHRHPAGAEVGSRLPLPPGRYDLELNWDALAGPALPGSIEVRGEDGSVQRIPLEAGPGGGQASFDVKDLDRAVSLAVRTAGPFLLKEIRLRAQPSRPGPV